MPPSQQPPEGIKIVLDRILSNQNQWVLDVGCGDGKWGIAIKGKVQQVHGIEIWGPYIEKHNLKGKYDVLYHGDVCNFDRFDLFNTIIMGDVLEHIEHDSALHLIETIRQHTLTIYLTIPISLCMQDGFVYGNPHESHVYQWKHEELAAIGFDLLHAGMNARGLVKIGTYEMQCGVKAKCLAMTI